MSREDYKKLETAFLNAPGSLCEETDPRQCDCSRCPTRDLCRALCEAEVTK